MAEMVVSALVQDGVSRGISSMVGNREEKVSKPHNLERLEMAHTKLEFTLEVSSKMPIVHPSLLRRRAIFKRKYEACSHVLDRCKLQLLEDDQEADDHQGVKHISSLPRRIIRAVRSFASSSFGLKKDELSSSDVVARLEWCAEEACKFVRDVETGCSLSHYRFISPLTKQLLQMEPLTYIKVRGSQANCFFIVPMWTEESGAMAWIWLFCWDGMATEKKNFSLHLLIRLLESTNIVGITTECLKSLGPIFKPSVEAAIREVTELTTRVSRLATMIPLLNFITSAYLMLQDPICCRVIRKDRDGTQCNNTVASKLPSQVICMTFSCFVPASGLQGSVKNVARGLARVHLMCSQSQQLRSLCKSFAMEMDVGGEQTLFESVALETVSSCEMDEVEVTRAIDHFIYKRKFTQHAMDWLSGHGNASIRLQKPSTEMSSEPKTSDLLELLLRLFLQAHDLRICSV